MTLPVHRKKLHISFWIALVAYSSIWLGWEITTGLWFLDGKFELPITEPIKVVFIGQLIILGFLFKFKVKEWIAILVISAVVITTSNQISSFYRYLETPSQCCNYEVCSPCYTNTEWWINQLQTIPAIFSIMFLQVSLEFLKGKLPFWIFLVVLKLKKKTA